VTASASRSARSIVVGVVSDTHLPRFGRELPAAVVEGLTSARVELILHLGDMTDPLVPPLFEAIAPFDAVAGNNDGDELVARFGRRKIVEVGGIRFGLVHGDQGFGRTTPERAAGSFKRDEADVVLFGHSHIPLVQRLPDGRWLLNPGSPTDKRSQPRYSFAVIWIDPATHEIRPEIRAFDDRATAWPRTSPSR
jgi:uncharacterized protein